MSANVKKHMTILKKLSKSSTRDQRKLLRSSPRELIDALSEITVNVLNGRIRLTPEEIHKLKRYNSRLLRISKKSTPIAEKRRIIQRGGFLSVLLPAAIAVITSLVSSI